MHVTTTTQQTNTRIIHSSVDTVNEECSIVVLDLAFRIGGIEATAINDSIRCESQEHGVASGMDRTRQLTATKHRQLW